MHTDGTAAFWERPGGKVLILGYEVYEDGVRSRLLRVTRGNSPGVGCPMFPWIRAVIVTLRTNCFRSSEQS